MTNRALFDIDADGLDAGVDVTDGQILALTLRVPVGVRTWQLQVWDAAGYDPAAGILTNPPKSSPSATELVLDNGEGSTGQSVTMVRPADSASVQLPVGEVSSWIIRSVVDGGTKIVNGESVIDPERIWERMIAIRNVAGARCIVATELRQYSDDGIADWAKEIVDAMTVVFLPAGTALGEQPYFDGSWKASRDPAAARRSINFVGDSNTSGSNGVDTGMVGAYRHSCLIDLRSLRDDFELVGHRHDTPENITSFGSWLHSGVPGYKLSDMRAAWAGYGLTPDVVVDMLGTNDIAGAVALATMQADRAALTALYVAANADVEVVCLAVPQFVAGTTVGGNLAAWNAAVDAYNAWLSGWCATNGYRFLDATALLGPGCYLPDGVHLNHQGQAILGRAVAVYLNRLFGPPVGKAPREFRQRKPWASQACLSSTSTLGATHAGYDPGAGRFAFAIDYYPTELLSGVKNIASYGAYGAGGWGLYASTGELALYWDNAPGTIPAGSTGTALTLALNTWHRIVIIASTTAVALYVNGRLVGHASGIAPTFTAGQAVAIGKHPSFDAARGYYSRVHAFKGSSVPEPGSVEALRAVEADYFLGEAICADGSAAHQCNATLADDIDGGAILVQAGGAATTGAWPAGTPARPWEHSPRQLNDCTYGGTGGTICTVGDSANTGTRVLGKNVEILAGALLGGGVGVEALGTVTTPPSTSAANQVTRWNSAGVDNHQAHVGQSFIANASEMVVIRDGYIGIGTGTRATTGLVRGNSTWNVYARDDGGSTNIHVISVGLEGTDEVALGDAAHKTWIKGTEAAVTGELSFATGRAVTRNPAEAAGATATLTAIAAASLTASKLHRCYVLVGHHYSGDTTYDWVGVFEVVIASDGSGNPALLSGASAPTVQTIERGSNAGSTTATVSISSNKLDVACSGGHASGRWVINVVTDRLG